MQGVSDLAARLRSGELAVGEHLATLEERIDRREAEVQALVPEAGRFERLRRQAAELVERWPEPAGRPPLYGVAVGVKDIFHVDGFETRAGSRLPPSELEGPESTAVSQLEAAGALILGKTVSTEFAYFGPGPTRNPRDPTRTPGGSSSGSAAAVGAGFCDLALGTQTIGSICRPASFCGVVGFKPSYERISRAGVIPLSPSLDHVGLFAPDVEGAALVAGVLCEEWAEAEGLPRPRLGVPEGPYLEKAGEGGRFVFHAAIETLEAAGYSVVRVRAFEPFDEIAARHRRIVAAEAARVHMRWYDQYADLYHPKTVELVETGRRVTGEQLSTALEGRAALRDELAALAEANGIDLWLSPAAPGEAPVGLESTGDPVMNLPWTHAGLPSLAIPAGLGPAGLPVGLQVVAGWWQDEKLLRWGARLAESLG